MELHFNSISLNKYKAQGIFHTKAIKSFVEMTTVKQITVMECLWNTLKTKLMSHIIDNLSIFDNTKTMALVIA